MALDNDILKFRKQVISLMQVTTSDKELINAIYLHSKIQDIEADQVKIITDRLMNIILVYYGVKEKDHPIYVDMKEALPKELKKYYAGYTLEEISYGINGAIRGFFGEIKNGHFTVSLKMFRELINVYTQSDLRKKLIGEFKQRRNELDITPYKSEDEQQQIVFNSLCYKFGKYKDTNDECYLSGIDYNALLKFGAMPDFNEFMPMAFVKIRESNKQFKDTDRVGNVITLSEGIIKQFRNTTELEAKKMTLKKFYDSLIAENKELELFINSKTE